MAVAACLLLEWGVSTAAVAVGWSEYVNELLRNVFGFQLPMELSNAPEQGGIINLPAVILITLCSLLLIRGTRESVMLNSIMVVIKMCVLVFFIVVGITGWNTDHFANFAPHGFAGIMSASGTIFFSFIGVDAIATAGAEAKNPKRDLPIAIIASLLIVTVLYIATAAVAVGAQPIEQFEGQEAGLSAILSAIVGSPWPGTVVAIGAIISIFSVTLISLYAQTRILYTMARDGMVPPVFARTNPRTMTPVQGTIIVAVLVSIPAGIIPINFLAEMTSIGTLAAFMVVSAGVIILRRREPDLERGFKVPLFPLIPILSIAGCVWIIFQLDPVTIVAFAIWTAAVLVFYWFYGRKHSALERGQDITPKVSLHG
jgi:amino acid transporter